MSKELESGHKLPLMEDFYSVQGEGVHSGKPAYFIRLGGCDVGCSWCDVKEAWDGNIHKLKSVNYIVEKILKVPAKAVVITGGEPLRYNLSELCKRLKENNIKMYLETSGTNKLTGSWDWITLSPKSSHKPNIDVVKKASELKVIIAKEEDFAWAEEMSKQVSKDCLLYMQPEWSKWRSISKKIIAYILKNPKWRISIQQHKYLQIP